jgi:flagella basal body P-ring formation protein FlgA
MLISTRGKALESGVEGDIINVLNIQSSRTLQATVIGPGRVSVNPSGSVINADGAEGAEPAKLATRQPLSRAE